MTGLIESVIRVLRRDGDAVGALRVRAEDVDQVMIYPNTPCPSHPTWRLMFGQVRAFYASEHRLPSVDAADINEVLLAHWLRRACDPNCGGYRADVRSWRDGIPE